MNKIITGRRAITLVLLLWLLVGAGKELSASQSLIASPSVPVTVRETGQVTQPETYFVYLEADEETMPMPIGSQGGLYCMEFAGAGAKSVPAISFEEVGVYSYRVYQRKGDNENCSYDDRIYCLTIYVTYEESTGAALRMNATLHCEDGDEKVTEIIFENVFSPEETPNPPSTGDDLSAGPAVVMLLVSLTALAFALRRRYCTE